MKLFKKMGQVARWDADTEIAHGHHSRIALSRDTDRHVTSVRGVLDGVADQICHHALESLGLPFADKFGFARFDAEPMPLTGFFLLRH
jgi:hypothetical protein